jgi:hypothetical protein
MCLTGTLRIAKQASRAHRVGHYGRSDCRRGQKVGLGIGHVRSHREMWKEASTECRCVEQDQVGDGIFEVVAPSAFLGEGQSAARGKTGGRGGAQPSVQGRVGVPPPRTLVAEGRQRSSVEFFRRVCLDTCP